MFCSNCGTKFHENAEFCSNCGNGKTPVSPRNPIHVSPPQAVTFNAAEYRKQTIKYAVGFAVLSVLCILLAQWLGYSQVRGSVEVYINPSPRTAQEQAALEYLMDALGATPAQRQRVTQPRRENQVVVTWERNAFHTIFMFSAVIFGVMAVGHPIHRTRKAKEMSERGRE